MPWAKKGVADAEMKGEVVFVQLKAHLQAIPWKDDGTYSYSGIGWTTARYWLSLEVPVFLVVADLDAGTLHYANAKSEIRSKYAEQEKHETLSITVHKSLVLNPLTAVSDFYRAYRLERAYRGFAVRLLDLVINQEAYYDFLSEGLSRDFDDVLDPEDEIRLFHLLGLVQDCCQQLGLPSPPLQMTKWLEENEKLDKQLCADGSFYGVFRMRLSQWLYPWLFLCLPATVDRVFETEAAYWREADFILFHACRRTDRLFHGDSAWWQCLHPNDPFHQLFSANSQVTSENFVTASDLRMKEQSEKGSPFW